MGIFTAIFGRTDNPWNDVLKREEIDEQTKFIIKKFFIADNISLEKYSQNQIAYSTYVSHGKYFAKDLTSTPSLEFASDPLNSGRAIPDWFIIAYPDVIKWMTTNSESIRTLHKSPYIVNDLPTPVFFRAVIQKFLYSGSKLECL